MKRATVNVLISFALFLSAGCQSGEKASEAKTAAAPTAPAPVMDALDGPPRPALLLTQAWFWTGPDGKSRPGPARLDIWREKNGRWSKTRLEDADSNVFHKALPYDGGILTIGAEKAMLKKWTFAAGAWKSETIWEQSWGGQFDRLRDVEIGDVDGDGKDEIVIASHDAGVVAVIDPGENGAAPVITEMDQKVDTFVHEIEIGDVDGDGKLEFFATPSDRNKADASQAGGVVMYRYDGSKYVRTWIEEQHGTHAKEILAYDMDGDGKSEIFAVLEAEIDPKNKKKMLKPVEIRRYDLQSDGSFKPVTIATIPDRQTRFLIPGDFDGDGVTELIAPALRTGLYHITPPASGEGEWTTTLFDKDSSGFEHAAYGADLDGDGTLELYVAADDQGKLRRYIWENGKFARTDLGDLGKFIFTWNITHGIF